MRPILLATCLLMCLLSARAQESVSYSYDNAGNRTTRTIVLSNAATRSMLQDEAPKPYVEKTVSGQITIYPNPTQGALTLEITGMETIDGQAAIYDLSGSLLYQTDVSAETQRFDLSSYANGVYILRLVMQGKTRNWKIIKK